MDGPDRVTRAVRPPPPLAARPSVPAQHQQRGLGSNNAYQCTAPADNESDGNPYEYIEDQRTLTANRKHAGGFVDNPVDPFTPDVPPRNLSMGRANSQGHGRGHTGPDREPDYEPNPCLARTPSGSIFIPSDLPRNSSPQHKTSSSSSSPKKSDTMKTNSDRCQSTYATNVLVPNVPVRNNLRRPTSNHFSHSRFQLRKTFPSRCSWKCTAILFIFVTLILSAALAYFAAMSMLQWQPESGKTCSVMVEDVEPQLTAVDNSTYRTPAAFSALAPRTGTLKAHRHLARSQTAATAMQRARHIRAALPPDAGLQKQQQQESAAKSANKGAQRADEKFLSLSATDAEGSGYLDGSEQSDFPAQSPVENSISPLLHVKGMRVNGTSGSERGSGPGGALLTTNDVEAALDRHGSNAKQTDHHNHDKTSDETEPADDSDEFADTSPLEEGFIYVGRHHVPTPHAGYKPDIPDASPSEITPPVPTSPLITATTTSSPPPSSKPTSVPILVSSPDSDTQSSTLITNPTPIPKLIAATYEPNCRCPCPCSVVVAAPPASHSGRSSSSRPAPDNSTVAVNHTSHNSVLSDDATVADSAATSAAVVVTTQPPGYVLHDYNPSPHDTSGAADNGTAAATTLSADPTVATNFVQHETISSSSSGGGGGSSSDVTVVATTTTAGAPGGVSTAPPSPPPPPPLFHSIDSSESSAATASPISSDAAVHEGGDHVADADNAVVEGDAVPGPTQFPAKTLPPDGATFMEIELGRRVTNDIPPYGHWNAQFHQPRTAFVRFNYTIPREASIGIYGRRNAIPTHTQYDFVEILSGEEKRRKRNLKETINIVFIQYLDAGQWYLSMYNDDNKLRDVSFITSIADELSVGCPYDCHDHGTCVRGHCECYPGFTGHDCARSVCPVLCSGNGEYQNGHCSCKPGWKGRECNLRYDECEVPGCNGHGHCIDGKCRCAKGYKGEFCDLVDCLVPDCSAHGVCVEGSCVCHRGWKGDACNDVDGEVRRCLPDCSSHGKFDLEKVKCVCDAKWTGPDCSKELCDLDCGSFGRCESGRCHCDGGWSGARCEVKTCDPRCSEHGQCKNGTCICVQGWNGRHCTLDGCPRNCHNHGECVQARESVEWSCLCHGDWEGADCSVPLERNCNDLKDNDNDGLTDCEDSECCSTKGCPDNLMCVSTADPLEILLKKQPPAVTASFFQRMRFLIEEDSVQNYVRKNAFNESRASVIRGRVVSGPSGSGIVGVRVSTTNSQEGFTLTRQSGWFDLMVNGGGAVTLQIQRDPFRPVRYAVMVPWNEVVIINNNVPMWVKEEEPELAPDPCTDHDYDGSKPVVLATCKHEFLGGCPEKSVILAESQVLQESLTIPGTALHLVYHSSRAAGYLSTIQLQLTPERIPKTLRLIHLRISIEGILFEKTFEADPELKYTYAWNRRNVYRQRVYGVTTATVSVGYEYGTCKTVIWDVQTTKLSGHDMSISDIGGWNLDIHHRYNFHEGILQKGDGTNIYLRYKPRVLLTTMGNGQQRPLDCPNCNGVASEQRLVAPVALTAAPDGSLFVGDFNLVRRIMPDHTVQTVLKLNPALVSYRYHLTVSPVDGSIHLSDPERHQILRIKGVEDIADLENNYEVVIGSGERCLPGDKNNCGDGGLAKDAKLMYPKGVVFSADGIAYLADGTNIRMVDKKGLIHTLIGDHRHKGHWKPIPCHGTLNLDEVHLRWPTELAINPLDGSLHIIDDHMILKLTPDGRIKVVAGQPLHCPSPSSGSSGGGSGSSRRGEGASLASHTTLIFPESMAFAPSGELYIAESDSQRINRIRVIGTDGRISDFAGVESKCNCLERDCRCFDEDHFLASLSKLSTVSSIAVTPDGAVHIADQGNLRVRSVTATLPEPTRARKYEIHSPETQEVYVFNHYGLHVATRNILTGKSVYTFTYNLNTSFGKLSSITDSAGNKIFMLRDYSNLVNTIENTHGQKVRLANTRMKMLQDFVMPGAHNVTFDYHGSTGLLRSKRDSLGQSFVYAYDENGRLTEAVTPSGEVVQLQFDLSVKGAQVKVTRDRGSVTTMLIKGLTVTSKQGQAESQIAVQSEGSVALHSPWGRSIITETSSYPLLSDQDPVLGESFPVPSRQKILIHDDLVHRLEWRYYMRKDGKGRDKHISQVIRKMKVNGDNLLAVEYDRDTFTESLFDHNQVALLSVKYDTVGRPERWAPAYNVTPVELKYDRFGRLAQWVRGDIGEQYGFDREGRLSEIRYSDDALLQYKFDNQLGGMPTEMTLPSGQRYTLEYDEAGSLRTVVTPRGHRHEFSIQTSLGFYKLQYVAPSMRQPFVQQYNDRGELLAKIYPGLKGRVSYAHDADGKLQALLFGDSKIEYAHYPDTGLVKSVAIEASGGFDCRTDYKYHGALLKEEKLRFGNKLGLSGVRIKYQYDGNARFQRCELEIGGKEVYPLSYNYNVNTGALESVMQFSVRRTRVNETLIESKADQLLKTRSLDPYGRLVACSLSVAGREVYRAELVYDNRTRVRLVRTRGGGSGAGWKVRNYTYTPDGLLEESGEDGVGGETWRFRHDENGNVAVIARGTKETKMRYNEADRLIAYGDFDMNVIDGRGFVVQKGEEKFIYNAHAQLISAAHRNLYEVHYHYDSRGRLIARKDTQGNITQYFYTHVRRPQLLTHVHHSKTAQTFQLTYDERDHLLHVEHRNSNAKYFVACDHLGTPQLVVDPKGDTVKEMQRSPFGAMLRDTNPHFYLPVDFHGGLRDPITGMIHYGARVYDPVQTQWMTPDWENIFDYVTAPQTMYLYRFKNNDPINLHDTNPTRRQNYYTELSDWLPLFGFNLEDIVGVREEDTTHRLAPAMPSSLPVISGLGCAADVINREFHRLSFEPAARVKAESQLAWRRPPIARRRPVFGDGILVSRLHGRAVVHVLDGASQVLQDVVVAVLNDSHFLDIHFTSHGQDVFHFVREGPSARVHEDHVQLQRLGGLFNVSVHDSEHGKDLKLHGGSATINIRYGTTVEQERSRLLKHARKRAAEMTWDGRAGQLLSDNLMMADRRRRSGRRRRKGRQSPK